MRAAVIRAAGSKRAALARGLHLVSGRPTLYDTRAALLWDDQRLYVGYWVEEPNVEATLTTRDAPIYTNNDVELFIAGRDSYYEFEVNAFNTIYEVFFVWEHAYDTGGFASVPQLARSHPQVRPFNGVEFTGHPRGRRLGSWAWDFPGLRSAVHVDGTLNRPGDTDVGWTVELAFPWPGMKWLAQADGRSLPPKDGDVWRMDLSRFNQYKAPASDDSGGWALEVALRPYSPRPVTDIVLHRSRLLACLAEIRAAHPAVYESIVLNLGRIEPAAQGPEQYRFEEILVAKRLLAQLGE